MSKAPQANAFLPWQGDLWERLCKQHKQGQLAHAYLACGEQGIGKFQLLRHFADYLLCRNPAPAAACGSCVNCELGRGGFHPDILIVAPEEGSRDIKIDQIRALSEFVTRTSHSGLMKVIVIEHAHQLNVAAANSLLKTLEEPVNNTVLFLVTARPGSLPATLRSRCQRLLFPTPGTQATVAWLQAQGLEADQAGTLAVAAGGRPLYAQALVERDGLATAEIFLGHLARLLQSRQTLQTAVTASLKLGETSAVEYLQRISTIVIRSLSIAELPEDRVLAGMLELLLRAPDRRQELLRALLDFNMDVESALRQVQGSTNPNPQLLMESLLWQWSELGRMARQGAPVSLRR